MRKYTSVDAVATALLGALGVLGACGGTVSTPAGKGGQLQADVGAAGAGDAGAPSCTKHPCASPQPIVVGGVDTGFDTCASGTVRRRAVVTCPSLLPRAGTCNVDAGPPLPPGGVIIPDSGVPACATDSDCTAQANGQCVPGYAGCVCSYGCRTDSDCDQTSGEICLCGDPVGTCVSAGCAESGDCGPGCDCEMPSGFGFACQTPEDTCASGMDCSGQPAPEGGDGCGGSCPFSGFLCVPQSFGVGTPPGFSCQATCGCFPGRPFLVHGAERTAEGVMRADWRADLAPDTTSCTDSQRSRAAAHWARVGAMEHASIAAFARFTLHLLSLGAPAELVTLAQQAMGDETEHARLAYALASAYAGMPLGPGALAIHGSLDASSTGEILATLVREGCVGETLAAIEARDALEHDLDPAVRTALEVIARDELRHAALAWKTLAWLLECNRVDLRAVRDEMARALSETTAATAPSEEPDDLRAFGVVTRARSAELRRHAAHEAIARCADSLVAPTRRTSARANSCWCSPAADDREQLISRQ